MTSSTPTRRQVIAAAGLLPLLPRARAEAAAVSRVPADFLWGVSTSAAQIEGAADADGRGPSIWDAFAREGRVRDGDSPAVAADHYRRWPEDVALMQRLGIGAYRFSIAWPRVIPEGTGPANEKGWDFYGRLVDGLLESGIRPMPCLYHWDLPLALHRRGGWLNRDIAGWLAEYAEAAARRLGDRVGDWFVLNEPSVVAINGYGERWHAPGLGGGADACLAALHHQNLAQGAALRALRAELPQARLGTVLCLQPVVAESDRPEDRAAAIRWDAAWNRVALDGLLRGRLPDVLAGPMAPLVRDGDLEAMRVPVDRLGVNYYGRMTMRAEPGRMFGVGWGRPRTQRFTGIGWPIQPDGLLDMLLELKELYGNPPVVITENGAAFDDRPDAHGRVADPLRVGYLRDHVAAVLRARAAGCRVEGYMPWSLLDNFEWEHGHSRRFGIVYVDYASQARLPKDSYRWYRETIAAGRPV